MIKTIEATQLPIRALDHGEGACWWAQKQALLWVDIHGGEVHLYDPVTGEDRMWKAPSHVGFAHPTTRGDVILGIQDGIARLDLDSGEVKKLVDPEAELGDQTRMNDGKPGPDGRLYAGTMAYSEEEPIGSLWRIEKDFSYTRIIDGVTVSNGLCWSADGGTFYYIDSPTRQVVAYDFDLGTGDLSNRRVVIEVAEADGFPDGMTIDAAGYLWVAHWEGSMVGCYDPRSGEMIAKVTCPAPKVTCPSFGGPELDTLYFTTSQVGSEQLPPQIAETTGCLYACKPGVKGMPGHHFVG